MAEFVLGLLVGIVGGMVLLARWWSRQMMKPEYCSAYLREMYRRAQPHWLGMPVGPTCPVCGWSEERGQKAQEAEMGAEAEDRSGSTTH